MPHAPQLFGSLPVFTQLLLLQLLSPLRHWHEPLLQVDGPPHEVVQLPQCDVSELVFTQIPPQLVNPAGQVTTD